MAVRRQSSAGGSAFPLMRDGIADESSTRDSWRGEDREGGFVLYRVSKSRPGALRICGELRTDEFRFVLFKK